MNVVTIVAVAFIAGTWPAASVAQQVPVAVAQQESEAHEQHQHQAGPRKPQAATQAEDHEQHHHHHADAEPALPPHIPRLTDADRAAAFPDVQGHTVHDNAINHFVLFDQLEWQGGTGTSGVNWENKGWIGRDRDRLWFRTEGEGDDGRLESANAHALYGRAIAPWWDVVMGVRQDLRPGSPQTWAAVGLQGLAPYWFEVEATAYVGPAGRTHFRLETEYELLLTNRVILQPLLQMEVYGKSDSERGLGSGLSSGELGLRLRYEFRREFAPYVGVVWNRKFFGTADYARAAGESAGGARVAAGLRLWL